MFLLRLAFWSVRVLGRLFITAVLLGGIGLVVYTCFWLPPVSSLTGENPETTAFIERSREILRKEGRNPAIRQQWVPLSDISPELVKAVRIAEDDRFFVHNGFDFTEIRIAMETNIREKKWVRGASTLSQQLAKNLYLSSKKTLTRKFDEMLLTWKLEHALTKERILEIYLNVVDWGHGCFGAEAASRFYFSKPSSKLSAQEAANLAARLPNPHYLGSHSGENQRKAREKIILARMKKERAIPGRSAPAQRQERNEKPKPVSPKPPIPPKEAPSEDRRPMVLRMAKWGEQVKGSIGEWFQESNTLEVGNAEKPVTKAVPAPQPKPLPDVPRPVAPKQRVSDTVSAPAKVTVEPPSEVPAPLAAREDPNSPNNTKASVVPSKGESQLVQKLVQLQKAWSD